MFLARSIFILLLIHALAFFVCSQKLAIISPEPNELSESIAKSFESLKTDKLIILDRSLSNSAFFSTIHENPFNLSLEEAKNIGQAIGADFFVMIQAKTTPRYSLLAKEYFESFAAVFTVSSRTGRLVFWKLINGEGKSPEASKQKLFESFEVQKNQIVSKIHEAQSSEPNEAALPNFETLPDDKSPDAVNFRPPLPYRQISPKYPEIASFYGVAATVDILVYVDETGKILRSEISRWAGFGLDESVTKTVNEMNWRPADRNGKRLPMQILLRYNFKKLEPK